MQTSLTECVLHTITINITRFYIYFSKKIITANSDSSNTLPCFSINTLLFVLGTNRTLKVCTFKDTLTIRLHTIHIFVYYRLINIMYVVIRVKISFVLLLSFQTCSRFGLAESSRRIQPKLNNQLAFKNNCKITTKIKFNEKIKFVGIF